MKVGSSSCSGSVSASSLFVVFAVSTSPVVVVVVDDDETKRNSRRSSIRTMVGPNLLDDRGREAGCNFSYRAHDVFTISKISVCFRVFLHTWRLLSCKSSCIVRRHYYLHTYIQFAILVTSMPKLQAAVPAGAPPNALLRVRLPDGNEVNVRVPTGLQPGDEFIFEVTSLGEVISSTKSSSSTATTSAAATAKGGAGGGSSRKMDKQMSKNPKKKRSSIHGSNFNNNNNDNFFNVSGGGGGGGGGSSASSASSTTGTSRVGTGGGGGGGGGVGDSTQNPNAMGGISFFDGLNNLFNQYYDILILQKNSTNFHSSPTTTTTMSSLNRTGSGGSRQGGGGSHKRTNISNSSSSSSSQHHQSSSATSVPSSTTRVKEKPIRLRGLLNCELTDSRELVMALIIGTFIGLCIVFGFVAGVLYSTPIE